jgi:outer membrane autotransporter protein
LTTVDTGLQTGVAAGNATHGLHPWMQGFGSYASQGMRSDVAGYNASTYGAAFGLDTRELVDNTVLGVSFAYGRTNATSQNINNTSTNVNTYQGMIYGNHQFGEDFFVTGMGAFGWDTNSQTRYNVGEIAGLNASANYNAWQAATRWEVGHNFKDLPTGATLTPAFITDYLHYQASSYTETGAGGANLSVGNSAENILNVGLGLQAEWLIETADGSRFRPNLHATYKYDVLNNDTIDTSSSYAAGGGTFTTNGLNPGNSTTTLGTGMKFYNTDNWDFTASYDHTFKADYNSDSGLIRAAYKF